MASGRELLAPHLPIHGRGTWFVKAIILHPISRKVARLWKLWLGAVVLLFLGSKARSRRQHHQFHKQLPAAPSQVAKAPSQRARFVELLRPRDGGFFAAGPEITTLVLTSGLNAWLMLYKAWLMREFVIGQNLGHWKRWLKALAKFPFAILASALLSQTTKYMQARVALLWRQTATQRLLQSYFSDMNYYKLSQHGSARIDDPDIRICSDVRSGCDALTGVLISGLAGVTMSLFSSWALYRRRGLFAVFLPYLYSFFIVPLSYRLTSPDWSVAMQVHKANGAYQQALTRVQQAGESVAMLKGEEFEKDVLDQAAANRAAAERRSWAAMARFEWFQHYISNPAMPGMWQSVASFGAAFIAMRAYGPGRPVLDPREPNEAVVLEYGANISDFWQVFYAVRGAVTFMMAMETYKRSQQNLFRVEQLQEAFATLAAEDAEAATFNDGSVIAFEDVSIVTPTGIPLLAGLTFKVEPGRHLVICGHNGAGKSSIFRCLGGLWPVAKGSITCPAAFTQGLHGDVYYLPQRPVNILGTLSDQLTYPTRVPGGLPVEELRRWLGYVGMAEFVDAAVKNEGLEEVADWAATLSLSEQQRLGIARVLYHRPRFAILDECTSAVSKDLEHWLFHVANELGITYVTISHRPALLEHHHQMLRLTGRLEEDGRGWELVDLPSKLPEATHVQSAEEAHARIEALSRRGLFQQHFSMAREFCSPASFPSSSSRTSPQLDAVVGRYPMAAQRIAAALQLGKLSLNSKLQAALLTVLVLLRPQGAWEVFRTVGGSVGLAMCNDGPGLCAELFINIVYAGCLCCLDRLVEALSRQLSLQVWSDVAASLHHEALESAAFHRVGVENPMQRIAEARRLLDQLKGQLQYTGGQTVQMLQCLPLLVRGGGALPAATLVLLYATHFVVRTYWMPNIKALTAQSTALEDQFQVSQSRVRHVAEPVAFSGGGEVERQRMEEHFERLCEHRLQSMQQEFTYNFLTEFFLLYDNLPIWFHRLISFNFAWRNVPTGGASPASAVQNYLYDRTISMSLVGVQALTSFPSELAKMDSRATRLLELREALELASHEQPPPLGESHSKIVVRNLTLATPNQVTLAEGLTFQVERDSPILITGPNGAGKTALARVLLGLWKTRGADVSVSVPRALSIVPQRPYLAPGCLGDQVTYPKRFVGDQDASKAEEALKAVGLEHLLERSHGSWDARCMWEEVLSGGEQQRIALSRALFHRPDFVLLDECTSMVAADAEERLYDCVTAVGVTPLTMSQRLFLPKLHKQELRLGVDSHTRWSLAQLQNGSG